MSLRLNLKDNYMRKYFLFGLLALGLIALGPTASRADEGFSIQLKGKTVVDVTNPQEWNPN